MRARACVRGARRNNGSAAERRTRHRRVSVDPAGAVKVNVLRSAAVSGERASAVPVRPVGPINIMSAVLLLLLKCLPLNAAAAAAAASAVVSYTWRRRTDQ